MHVRQMVQFLIAKVDFITIQSVINKLRNKFQCQANENPVSSDKLACLQVV